MNNSSANAMEEETKNTWLLIKGQDFIDLILTRIEAGCFRISLSLSGQALLWKILVKSHKTSKFTILVPEFFCSTLLTIIWSFSLTVLLLLSLLYALKCLLRFNLIKAEFLDHVGVNYLFAPWISWLLVLESAPFVAPKTTPFVVFWWIFAVPVIVLDVKIYGQWFTKGKRVLTAVANPTSQLSVIGNLIGARAAAKMGWIEISVFLFSLGMVHYLVLFVTLYQRLPGGDCLPAMLRPVFSLFFAAPSVASIAWYSINGSFDTAAKMLFYLSLFLFASLICRPLIFKKAMKSFNLAWWAYSYPLTLLAIASTRYEQAVPGLASHVIRLVLSCLSALVLLGLVLFTAVRPKSLLPDDDSTIVSGSQVLPIHSPNTTTPSASP